MTGSLPRHAWGSCKSRRKGARLWAWPPVAHAAAQGMAPGAQLPRGARRQAAPSARRHFGGRVAPGVGAPPARLPDDTGLSYELARVLFLFADSVALPILAFIAALILRRLPWAHGGTGRLPSAARPHAGRSRAARRGRTAMLNKAYFLELAGWITAVSAPCVSVVGYTVDVTERRGRSRRRA